MTCGDLKCLAIALRNTNGDVWPLLAVEEVFQADSLDDVSRAYPRVVGFVDEPEREDALFLQICLVDSSKGTCNDDSTTLYHTSIKDTRPPITGVTHRRSEAATRHALEHYLHRNFRPL